MNEEGGEPPAVAVEAPVVAVGEEAEGKVAVEKEAVATCFFFFLFSELKRSK